MTGPGVLKYFDENLILGYWKNSKLHGFVYKYDATTRIWTHQQYEMGILIRTFEENRVFSSFSSGFILINIILTIVKQTTIKKTNYINKEN